MSGKTSSGYKADMNLKVSNSMYLISYLLSSLCWRRLC